MQSLTQAISKKPINVTYYEYPSPYRKAVISSDIWNFSRAAFFRAWCWRVVKIDIFTFWYLPIRFNTD